MVDQAQVTKNGHSELPPQAVARGSAEFLHDVTTLAELQGKLVLIDFREGMAKLLMPVILLCTGAVIGLGSVPIALATLALVIKATTTLNYASCFGISLAVGLVLAAILILSAWGSIKGGLKMFDRSLHEWGRNRQWVKDTLKRLSRSSQQWPHSARW